MCGDVVGCHKCVSVRQGSCWVSAGVRYGVSRFLPVCGGTVSSLIERPYCRGVVESLRVSNVGGGSISVWFGCVWVGVRVTRHVWVVLRLGWVFRVPSVRPVYTRFRGGVRVRMDPRTWP